jgi:GNAT superfamily N-acetyltransferase
LLDNDLTPWNDARVNLAPEPEALADLTPRRARADEVRPAAELWLRARRASVPRIPPPVHNDDEVRAWFQAVVFPSQELWVIEVSGQVVALMALTAEWLEQLYVDPARTGRGLGSRLVDLAQQQRDALDLWTFQANLGARRFYERHGFFAVATTDGDNEEGAPDVRYHWQRPTSTRPSAPAGPRPS